MASSNSRRLSFSIVWRTSSRRRGSTGIAPRGAVVTRIRIKSPARTTRHGLPGRNSWPGWGRSFRLSARTAAVTSGSEQTAGRSRLTSNRRFASGRRPGWLSPREVRFSHIGEPLEPPPVSPARGPPTDWGEFVQIHDDRETVQGRIDELPVIDIHSL